MGKNFDKKCSDALLNMKKEIESSPVLKLNELKPEETAIIIINMVNG